MRNRILRTQSPNPVSWFDPNAPHNRAARRKAKVEKVTFVAGYVLFWTVVAVTMVWAVVDTVIDLANRY